MALVLKLKSTSAVLCTLGWRMMSQTSTGCTLIGFCYLESYLNPKLPAANLNVDLCSFEEGERQRQASFMLGDQEEQVHINRGVTSLYLKKKKKSQT